MKAVIVDWVDSSSMRGVWHMPSDINSEIAGGLQRMRSIGWVFSENDKMLVLVSGAGVSTNADSMQGVMFIPKVAITRTRRVKGADLEKPC